MFARGECFGLFRVDDAVDNPPAAVVVGWWRTIERFRPTDRPRGRRTAECPAVGSPEASDSFAGSEQLNWAVGAREPSEEDGPQLRADLGSGQRDWPDGVSAQRRKSERRKRGGASIEREIEAPTEKPSGRAGRRSARTDRWVAATRCGSSRDWDLPRNSERAPYCVVVGRAARVTGSCSDSLPRWTVRVTVSPDLWRRGARRGDGWRRPWSPSTAVMTSFSFRPAFAAGLMRPGRRRPPVALLCSR